MNILANITKNWARIELWLNAPFTNHFRFGKTRILPRNYRSCFTEDLSERLAIYFIKSKLFIFVSSSVVGIGVYIQSTVIYRCFLNLTNLYLEPNLRSLRNESNKFKKTLKIQGQMLSGISVQQSEVCWCFFVVVNKTVWYSALIGGII